MGQDQKSRGVHRGLPWGNGQVILKSFPINESRTHLQPYRSVSSLGSTLSQPLTATHTSVLQTQKRPGKGQGALTSPICFQESELAFGFSADSEENSLRRGCRKKLPAFALPGGTRPAAVHRRAVMQQRDMQRSIARWGSTSSIVHVCRRHWPPAQQYVSIRMYACVSNFNMHE